MNAPVRSEILVGGTLETARLSPFHAVLIAIERQNSATLFNAMWNEPSIRPHIGAGYLGEGGTIDWSAPIADPKNFFFLGDHGGIAFIHTIDAVWEVHLGVLPTGRGEWARLFVAAATQEMFTKTPMIEVFARCPRSNVFVRKMAERLGWTYELTRPFGFSAQDGNPVAADIFRLGLLDWILVAPGLADRGRWFLKKLQREYERFNIHTDEVRLSEPMYRYIGAFIELIFGGNPDSAIAIFNKRFCLYSGWSPVELMEVTPRIVVRVNKAVLFFREQDFYLHSVG